MGILLVQAASALAEEPIQIAPFDRTTPVDFQTEILPILRTSCLACHNASKAESDLNLESPAAMLKGGAQGPAVVAGEGAKSLLLQLAAHQDEPRMPPPDNDVGARPLSSRELGLVKQWIDQGAAGEAAAPRPIQFQPLPPHVKPVFAAAVTPDGQFAACGRGNELSVYHLPTRQLAAQLADAKFAHEISAAHADVIRSLAFDPSGRWLASGGFREVKLWRRPHVAPLAAFRVEGGVSAAALSSDGKMAAIGQQDGRVRLHDLSANQEVRVLDVHSAAVMGVAFSPDGKMLITASRDKSIQILDVAGGDARRAIATSAEINALTLVGDEPWIVTGHEDHVIRVWDWKAEADEAAETAETAEAETAAPRTELKGHSQPITAMAALPSSKTEFISGSSDGTVRRWNAASGEQVRQFSHGEPVLAVAAEADGVRIASTGRSGAKLFNAEDGSPIAEIRGDLRAAAEVARIDAEIAFTKSALQLAQGDITAYEGPQRRVTTTAEAVKKAEDDELAKAETALQEKQQALDKAKEKADEKELEKAEKELADAQTARDVALTIVERAKVVAQRAVEELAEAEAGVARSEAKLKELEAQKAAAQEAAAVEHPVRAVAFTAGRRLIAGGENGHVQQYDSASGSPLQTMAGSEGGIAALAAADDGLLLAAGSDGAVRVDRVVGGWQLERTIGSAEDPATLADRALSIAFSPDGELLAVGGGLPSRRGELKIFRAADGQLVREIADAHADTVLAVAFSPDGKHLASAGADHLVRAFTVEDGRPVRTFAGHTAHATGVSFSGDGKQLASSGNDRAVKLWDFETGQPIHTMKGTTYRIGPYRREVTAVSFVGGSEQILAASGDGTVRLHRTSSPNDILTFADSAGYVYSAAASADGRAVVAGGSDGVLRLWSGHERSPKASFPPLKD